jgi:predicted oxidoreductase
MKNRLVTNQIEISLKEHNPFTNGDIAYLQEHGIAPMAWSPLGGGSLFNGENIALTDVLHKIAEEQNVEMSSVAIAWLLAHPSEIIPILGTNNLDRLAKISEAHKVKLDRMTWFELYTAALGREVA